MPVKEVKNDLISSNAMRFIDHIGELLQAYVDKRGQVRLIKELYGNQIRELYHNLLYRMIEFVLDDSDCKERKWSIEFPTYSNSFVFCGDCHENQEAIP